MVYNQQSIYMSLFASALELANKGNTEREAVAGYNGGRDTNYMSKFQTNLSDMGATFMSN